MTNKVSIVVPSYNSMEYINETLASCFSQTYSNLEVVVVDDGSTDGTRDYLDKNKNIIFLKNEQNCGISKSINRGVSATSGEFIILLGHDDILPCKHVEMMLESFCDGVGLVHCNALKINADGNIIRLARETAKQVNKTQDSLKSLAEDNFIQSCGLMFRKSVFESFGGWCEEYRLYGEWLAYIKFIGLSGIVYNKNAFALYRVHKKSTMRMINKDQKKSISAYKKYCRQLALSKIDPASLTYFERLKFRYKNAF